MQFEVPDEAPVIKPKPTNSAQLGVFGSFDQEIYTAGNRFEQYDTTIAATDDVEVFNLKVFSGFIIHIMYSSYEAYVYYLG